MILGESSLRVSRFALGTMNYSPDHPVSELIGTYTSLGGNFLDSAHCYGFWTPYGAGASERAIASHMDTKAAGGGLVIATKGGHPSVPTYRETSACLSPYRLRADIDDSLARLELGCIDLFWLHRDDVSVPVSEIIDFLNEEIDRGRIRHPGASNWSTARLQEANDYARKQGKQGFIASQPAFSLGMLSEETGGMRFLGRPEELEWHRQTKFPVVAYSPTAHGLFATGGSGRGFQNPTSARRLERATDLAAKHGVSAHGIAMAYLLCQDFPVIPILGTGNPDHLRDTIAAADLRLDPDEVVWLST
jgi:1-deoxyxylulose-5-phosphate synthase